MNEPRICPNCRETVPPDAPEGVCPACALRAGFDTGWSTEPRRSGGASPPMPVDELARRLPELDDFEFLGRGGMGAVYRARQRTLDRRVAVKVLAPDLRHDPAFAERFEREARTLAQLSHPNLVTVHDFGHRDGLYYLVMELVDGVTLRQAIRAGRVPPREALAMVRHICDALQYAHDRGVVHRDIKPENILVDRHGALKIADFGLARLVGARGGPAETATARVMGTPTYMAPEQIERPGEVDHRADIYALGVVFYELLTGELPIGRFPPPSQRVQVDVRLDRVVLRTLEKEPRLRYQQASELGTDVASLSSATDAELGDGPPRSRAQPGGREYRSPQTMFGLPLVHLASSNDPDGRRYSVARGVFAMGDVAIGVVAIGGVAVGGFTFGGLSVGLVSLGGLAAALLAAIGGFAVGGYAYGGFAAGLVARGGLPFSYVTLSEPARSQISLIAWLLATLCVTVAAVALVRAWQGAARERPH